MNIPEAFRYMVMCFHQDIMLEASNQGELVSVLVRSLNAERQTAVRAFLDELLSRNPSGAELQQVWSDCEPDWGIRDDEGLRLFLTTVRDRLPVP